MNIDDSDELKKNKKYAKFQSELQRCLVAVERTPLSDWASLNNGLVQIQKVIDSTSYVDLPVIPERMLLCRVLGKCLDPLGAMGVHRKAVETLSKICAKLGPRGIAESLPLLSVGVFHLLPMAAMQTRPDIITLLETHFLTLPIETLLLCLSGLMGAVLPMLEESDTSELYRRSLAMVLQMHKSCEDARRDALYFHAVWSIVRNSQASRVGALVLLRMLLKRADPLPTVDEQQESNVKEFTRPSQLTESSLAAMDINLVLTAVQVSLQEKSEKCLRCALDVLVFHFPLHEDGVLTFHDKVSLMTASLRVLVSNPQNAILRRVFMWIYGGNEYNTTYFRVVSSRYIAQALMEMFTSTPTAAFAPTLPFEALSALLGRPEGEEHFHELIPEVMSSLCGAMARLYRSAEWQAVFLQRIFSLLDVMPWSHFLQYVSNECCDEVTAFAECGSVDESGAPEVLRRMLAILDATRSHYIALPNSAQCVSLVTVVCAKLCGVVEAMCRSRTRSGGGVPCSHVRLALEVFHVAHFGIAKGLAALQDASEDREGLVPVVSSMTAVFTTLCEAHCGENSSLSPDDLFSTAVVRSGAERDEVRLLTEVCDTMMSLLTDAKGNCGVAADSTKWLQLAERVVLCCATDVAVCCATLVFETHCNDALTPEQVDFAVSSGLFKRLLLFLWSLFTVGHSDHHVHLCRLFMQLSRKPHVKSLMDEMMGAVHPANCRQFVVLFRLFADQPLTGTDATCFEAGVVMMMDALSHPDSSVRLIASSFVDQSLPFLGRIVEPLLLRLLHETPATARGGVESPVHVFLAIVSELMHTVVGRSGAAVVQRLWSLPPPVCSGAVWKTIDDMYSRTTAENADQRDTCPDNDPTVSNTFSLLLSIAMRVLRRELRRSNSVAVAVAGSQRVADIATIDEVSLASSSTPSVVQGEESKTCILAVDLMLSMIRCSVSFPDPPETVANVCTTLARTAGELLPACVAARLPTVQVQLLELLQVTVRFLDQSGRATIGRRGRSHSESSTGAPLHEAEGGAADATQLGVSPPHRNTTTGGTALSASKLRRGPSGRDAPDPQQVSTAVLYRDTLQLFRQGLVSAAVAELHPTLNCYGLFGHWRSALTSMLPLFHELLHDAVYETVAAYCAVIKALRQRPLSTTTGGILNKAFHGLADLLAFLFKPTTRTQESSQITNAATQPESQSSRKLESVTQLPMWLIQQGLGAASGDAAPTSSLGSTSNYELAMKELLVCLDIITPTCFETFLLVRRASIEDSNRRQRDAGAALQTLRLMVETPVKVLLETLIKDMELDFYEKLIWFWIKRNGALLAERSTDAIQLLDGSDECLIVEMLATSAGITPISVVNACEQLLQRCRRGAMKGSASATARGQSLSEMPFDVAVLHFLLYFFTRCKGADRFDKPFTTLLDVMLLHVGHSTASPAGFPVMLKLLSVMSRRFNAAVQPTLSVTPGSPTLPVGGLATNTGLELGSRDKRAVALLVKILESAASFTSALVETDEVLPLTLRLLSEVFPDFAGCFISREHTDRVAEAFGSLYSRVLGPLILTAMNHKGGYEKILQLSSKVNTSLSVLHAFLSASDALIPKKLKNDLIDILFSQSFFKMSRLSVNKWRRIFEKLTADRTINAAILTRFNSTTTPQSVLTAIVQSQDDEASARGRFLKRLAFYVFSAANLDREFVSGVREKLSDTFRQFGRHAKLVPVRYALLVFRVLMTRVQPQLLTAFWPVIIPELVRCLAQRPTGDDDFYLAMEALKVVDFAVCVLPSDFQVFRWVFLDDDRTMDALHGGSSVALTTEQKFIPLVRRLAGDRRAASRSFSLTSVRREMYTNDASTKSPPRNRGADAERAQSGGASRLHRPLLAVPERCYFDVEGIDVVCEALHLASNACSTSVVTELHDTTLGGDWAPASDMRTFAGEFIESEAEAIVRRCDQCDQEYLDWLLEAEFLHVGVAASEQKTVQVQAQAIAAKLQAAAPSSPPNLSPRDGTGDFVDVQR